MKTSNSFALSKMTNTDLTNLYNDCIIEMRKREEQRAARRARRAEWIEDYYWDFMNHPNASVQIIGQRTIVAIYSRNDGVQIGSAYPIDGDIYNKDTGIAVAYAKAIGVKVPDYI